MSNLYTNLLRRTDLISEEIRFKNFRLEKAKNKKVFKTNAQLDKEEEKLLEYQQFLTEQLTKKQLAQIEYTNRMRAAKIITERAIKKRAEEATKKAKEEASIKEAVKKEVEKRVEKMKVATQKGAEKIEKIKAKQQFKERVRAHKAAQERKAIEKMAKIKEEKEIAIRESAMIKAEKEVKEKLIAIQNIKDEIKKILKDSKMKELAKERDVKQIVEKMGKEETNKIYWAALISALIATGITLLISIM
jgi:hypothetical protein|tara:strand:+ start:436 stop:1176 length:741 start_codon:yes stop_codon:yes gene_type:complete